MSAARRAALVVATAVASLALAVPALAHVGSAEFEVLEAAEVAPGTVSLRLGITFEGDGEAAEGAIVEVVPAGPDGATTPSVRLAREADAGIYAGTFELDEPGTWTLTVTSSFPPGSTKVLVEVDGEADVEVAVTTDTTNLLVAAASGVIGGGLGLWVSKRRSARKRAAAGD